MTSQIFTKMRESLNINFKFKYEFIIMPELIKSSGLAFKY